MKAYTIETPELKTSNILPLGNKINLNTSLYIGDADSHYTIYLNGKKLGEAVLEDKVSKTGDTMTGDLVIENAGIKVEDGTITVKNLIVNEMLAVKDINILNFINTKADNADYTSFKNNSSNRLTSLENTIGNKVDNDVFETIVNLKADKEYVDSKASITDLNKVKSKTNNLEVSVEENTNKINRLDSAFSSHIDKSGQHIHLTDLDNLNISTIPNKANQSDLDRLSTELDKKGDKNDVDRLKRDMSIAKNDISLIQVDLKTAENNIDVLKEKTDDMVDVDEFALLRGKVNQNISNINAINLTFEQHVDAEKHLHLTGNDIIEINKVADKASKSSVDSIKIDIAEIRCNIEKLWEEIDQGKHGITRMTVVEHDDISNLSYIDYNEIILDVDINKASEITDEETKVPAANLIKQYTDEVVSTHANNTVVHINETERENWNNKAETSYVDERDNYVISLINEHSFVVVNADAEGHPDVPIEERKTTIIYLVKDDKSSEGDNNYIEWLWVEKAEGQMKWEKIGSTKVDLTGYAKEEYVDNAISTHASNSTHITDAERAVWNSKQDAISLTPAVNDDITDNSDFTNNIISHSLSLNKVESSSGILTGETKVPSSGAVADYVTSNFVKKTGDTMTGPLKIEDTYIKLYDKNNPNKYTGLTNNYIEVSDTNSISENLFDITSINKDFISCSTIDSAGNPQSFVLLDNTGDLSASNSLTTITTNTYYIESSYSNHNVIVNDNLKIVNKRNIIAPDGSEYPMTCGLFTNYIQPYSGNKITFLSFGEEELDITVTNTSRIGAESPIIKLTASENDCDIKLAGKSVYGHITDKHSHLTDNQLNVLDAAENGCFIYKPTEPDPERPDEPYKNVNPKLLMKNKDDSGYREATLQVDADTGSSIEIVKNNDRYSACISTGNRPNGSKIELTDNTVTIGTAYRQGAGNDVNTVINGNLNVGDSTTNYNLTLNGANIGTAITNTATHINDEKVHLSSDEKIAVDTIIEDISKKDNTHLASANNGEGSIAIIKPISNNSDIYLKSFTFKTRSDGNYKPVGKRMAIYCSNANEAPSLFKANSTSQETKYKLPTGWKYIGVSKNTFTDMPANTEFKYEFDNIKIEKGMMVAVMFTKFTDLNEDEFAWSRFGASAIWSETGDTKSKFYKTDLTAAISGGKYFTVYYKTEFVEYTGESIKEATSPITLCNNCVYNVNAANISIVQSDISNKLIKSTILFTPTADIETENVFSTQIDKIICYENTLLQNKLSIIEITQANIAGTNYITAVITPNIK